MCSQRAIFELFCLQGLECCLQLKPKGRSLTIPAADRHIGPHSDLAAVSEGQWLYLRHGGIVGNGPDGHHGGIALGVVLHGYLRCGAVG